MTSEAQANIQKFIYNLSTENYFAADKLLNTVLKNKVETRFSNAVEKIKNAQDANSGK